MSDSSPDASDDPKEYAVEVSGGSFASKSTLYRNLHIASDSCWKEDRCIITSTNTKRLGIKSYNHLSNLVQGQKYGAFIKIVENT